jgi:hypothetical protein
VRHLRRAALHGAGASLSSIDPEDVAAKVNNGANPAYLRGAVSTPRRPRFYSRAPLAERLHTWRRTSPFENVLVSTSVPWLMVERLLPSAVI